MLDNVLYGFQSSMNVFVGINGVDALVTRIQKETLECLSFKDQFTIEELSFPNTPDPGYSDTYRDLISRQPLMRAMMKFILHLMQSYGTSDGMRNLIDSTLSKSLLLVFQNSILFGHVGVFGLCVNIMSTFIHNEPTCLSILQEQKLPLAFLTAANDTLPISAEV